MVPIGGFFGLECWKTPLYHKEGFYLNSCRNALRYIVKGLGIKRIYIPFFTCNAVEEALSMENCEIIKYNLNDDFFPVQKIPTSKFIVYNNYFGLTGEKIKELSAIYPNLIVDNAQAFYSHPEGKFSIYSPRKFFGVPDGGILIGEEIPEMPLDRGVSYDVCSHLLKRIDLGPEAAYGDFLNNEEIISSYEIKRVSKLTSAIMGNINYEDAKRKRLDNFSFLHQHLNTSFPMAQSPDDVPLIYPFMAEESERIRQKLIENKVFCAKYWPGLKVDGQTTSIEHRMINNLISLPIDQRYDLNDMKYILNIIG